MTTEYKGVIEKFINMSSSIIILKSYGAVIGGILVTLAVGNYQSFGNMAPYTVSYIREHGYPENVTYMSFQAAYVLILVVDTPSMIVSGYLDEMLGVRLVVLLACLVYSLGYFLTAAALQLNFILVSLFSGVFGGFAVGFTFNTIGGNAALWFPKNRATASAISTAGLAVAPVMFSPIQTAIVNPNNLVANWTSPGSAEIYFDQDEVISRVPASYRIVALIMVIMSLVGTMLLFDHTEERVELPDEKPSEGEAITGALDLLRSSSYWVLTVSFCFMQQYPVFMMMNFKTFGQTCINDDSLLTYIGSTASVTGLVGRVVYGLLLDWTSVKLPILLSCVCQVSSMLLLGLSQLCGSSLVYAVVVHLAAVSISGNVIVFQDACWKSFSSSNKGLSVGLVNIGYSASVIIAVIVAATAIDVWSWRGIFLCLSVSPVIGFVAVLFLDESGSKREVRKEEELRALIKGCQRVEQPGLDKR